MITKEYLQQELAKRIKGYKPGVETTTDNIIAEMKSILVLVDALPDYEKKYNEALERAKAYHRNELAGSRREMTEYIFPELRESEDERVIRTLYYLVRDHDWVNGATKGEALTWLEKQKEPKPAWSEEDEKIMESLISLIETIGEYYISLETIDRYVAWLKSLRPSWKPSEEDKEMKLKILKYLSTRCSVEQFEEVEEWLNNKLK